MRLLIDKNWQRDDRLGKNGTIGFSATVDLEFRIASTDDINLPLSTNENDACVEE